MYHDLKDWNIAYYTCMPQRRTEFRQRLKYLIIGFTQNGENNKRYMLLYSEGQKSVSTATLNSIRTWALLQTMHAALNNRVESKFSTFVEYVFHAKLIYIAQVLLKK